MVASKLFLFIIDSKVSKLVFIIDLMVNKLVFIKDLVFIINLVFHINKNTMRDLLLVTYCIKDASLNHLLL